MSSRKREKPFVYHDSKRRRSLPLDGSPASDGSDGGKAPATVVVSCVPSECSVLDVKSRLEVYGPISRTRMETDGVAYVTFRSDESARSAFDASRDSSCPLTIRSVPVWVTWASDPIPQWKTGRMLSKLVRAELPLSSHGRGNKLGASPVVKPREIDNREVNADDDITLDYIPKRFGGTSNADPGNRALRVRRIVAYDDIL